MKTGIVILNHKTTEWIARQLEAMRGQQLTLPVCIVDNSNNQTDSEKINQLVFLYSDLNIYFVTSPNLGYFKGNLLGMHTLVKQDVTHALIINPDVTSESWSELVNRLSSYFQSDEKCFIAGPKITIPRFRIVSSPIIPFRLGREIAYNLFFPFSHPILKNYHTRLSHKSGRVFAVEGSAFLIDCQKAIDTQSFFENIFLYGEETIFGKIAQKYGWHIYFDNSVEVIHHHPPGDISPIYDKYLPLSYVEITKKFYSSQSAIRLFAASIRYRFFIRRLLTSIYGHLRSHAKSNRSK
jgi:GT2 family glycosyltransferase